MIFNLFIRSQLRKFWWNFANHATLLLASAILVSLFWYLFQDFLKVQLASLDERSLHTAQVIAACTLQMGVTFITARWRHHLSTDRHLNFLDFLLRIGSVEGQKKSYRLLLQGIPVAISVASLLLVQSTFGFALNQFYLLSGVSISIFVLHGFLVKEIHGYKVLSTSQNWSQISNFRRHQLIHHAVPGKGFLRLSVVSSLLIPIATLLDQSVLAIGLIALMSGVLASFGIIEAISFEMPGTWFEKQAGLTHDEWVKSWQEIANTFSLILATISGLSLLLYPHRESYLFWNIPIIAGFLPWVWPSFSLQLDATNKNINHLVAILLALFLGTALLASPWVAVIIPIIRTQALHYQKGRFYRT
jgi:hypothetical protein